MKLSYLPATAMAAITLLTGCAVTAPRERERAVYNNAPSAAPERTRFGVVRDIDVVEERSRPNGSGAILGAVIGGVIGNQIGSGSGRVAATGAGVIGGAVVGNAVEERNRRDDEFYRITVQFNNGAVRSFDYKNLNGLRWVTTSRSKTANCAGCDQVTSAAAAVRSDESDGRNDGDGRDRRDRRDRRASGGKDEDPTARNIRAIADIERAAKSTATRSERVAAVVARFCGSIVFVWIHVLWFGAWILLNTTVAVLQPQLSPRGAQ